MHESAPGFVHSRAHLTAVVLFACAVFAPLAPAWAQATEKAFTGIYAGAEAGALNVIGGALVDGVDTLAQDTRAALTAVIGGRYQFANRLVLGVEFGAGWEDGDLATDVPATGASVTYTNSMHTRIGGTAGVVLGRSRRTHVFAYVSELSRGFDVIIDQGGTQTSQQDDQGLLRYGGGLEQRIAPRLTLRGTLGSSRADFGDRTTNITPTRPLEAAVGLLFRF